MKNIIGIIASGIEMKNTICEMFSKEVKSGEILIDLLDEDRIEFQGRLLEEKGAKVIIGRSGGYVHTLDVVDVPVVNLEMTTVDILRSIKKAKLSKKRIVLFLSDVDFFDLAEWTNLVGNETIVERFDHAREICELVKKYKSKKDQFIIVGGGIPCSYADQFGIENIFINASKESIRLGVNYANKLIKDLHEQKYKEEMLKNVLDGVKDGIISIDRFGNVVTANKKALEIFGSGEENVSQSELSSHLKNLNLSGDREYKGNIVKQKNHTLVFNKTPIVVEDDVNGYIYTFQDITQIQKLEKKIRWELNKKGLGAKFKFEDIITVSSNMKCTIDKAKKISKYDDTVMIYGESGTGKEMFAQSIHNSSPRKNAPFVAVNCAALTESLLESELFGYEEGAFTGARKGGKPGLFELAHNGTIFLDEINSISSNLQSKLLRVIEEKEIMRVGSDYIIPLDVRIISASNESLKEMVSDERFRNDLFYRLNTLEIKIPPLRERKKDIIPLFNFYLNDNLEEETAEKLDEKSTKILNDWHWPGNVRELKNTVRRYMIFGEIDISENIVNDETIKDENRGSIDLKEMNKNLEKEIINKLIDSGLNKTQIAANLGISRTALWKKMQNN
ncbi:sigma 54-interacting transcriptional regulator [Alkalibacter mobilis]|uniref:sigma 54-interacting transcriptional regulator n=1 Tax=Alkalibacter mobilis TaxID=2787712 RepID=UPI00189EE417|nr:sigma 54-interacting transcriptional regulator [Alkalibacter mobilis]MBF7095605.1 sigma 54-interacting transcriptional regulator [Alkalibacter mobilis]